MPLIKGTHNKAQFENAIKKTLDKSPVPTKSQTREMSRPKSPKELNDIYDNMHRKH